MSLNPWFKSPFTDMTGALISHQWFGRCAKIEMKVIDCLEAYGLDQGLQKCDPLIQDFRECTNRQKQLQRSVAMRYERHRQYLTGERSKEELYAPPPRVDSF
ncbi:putative NADH:ubiquinone oxidoreductase, NDUFS5-15kDa [Trypoxylus dichotomus]